jgi:MinD superfamily P-loop ATPase
MFVCCCCGCCCGVLTTAKDLPRPADFFQTDFVAELDRDTCQSCGVCGTRCQMDAITSTDALPQVAEERCIGCGLCVTTCPSGAMRLSRKEGRKPPPKDVGALYSTIFQERFGALARKF